MSKRSNSKYKIDRRLGVNLWGVAKSPFNVRPYRPGEHGKNPYKPSDYGMQFRAKQQLKGYYGNITEKQFKKYYEKASNQKGDTSESLIGFLESRLDMVVYRMKFAPTVFAARQIVSHGHVLVDGKKVNIASFLVAPNSVVEIREKSKNIPLILESVNSAEREVPEYLDVDAKKLKGTYLKKPLLAEVPYPVAMEPHSVVEFYSR